MFGISLHGWEQLMLLSLLLVFATTAAVVILQRRETGEANHQLEEYKLTVESKVAEAKSEGIEAGKAAGNALLRAAELEKQAGQLRKDTAEANARAAESQLALEKLKAPRTLGPTRQRFVSASIARFKGQRYRVAISQAADDGLAFWESLYVSLEKAGWEYLPATGGPSMGNPPAGVPIAAMPGVEIRFDPDREREISPAALALGNALHADGTVVAVNRDVHRNSNEADRDILLIVLGARVPPP